MTPEQFRKKIEIDYGEAGLFASESMCLTNDDYALGYDHCVEKITPALEEELLSQESSDLSHQRKIRAWRS